MYVKGFAIEKLAGRSVVSVFIIVVRWLILLGVVLRFAINRKSYPDSIAVIVIIGILAAYTVFVTVIFIRRPEWYDPQRFAAPRIVFEVLLYSTLYLVTQNPQSDFFLFYFLPMLIASEYLDTIGNVKVFGFISIAFLICVILLSVVTADTFPDFWITLTRVFLGRWAFFLVVTFFVIYRMMTRHKQASELEANNQIVQGLLRGESRDKLLDRILEEAVNLLGTEGGTIYLRVPGKQMISLSAKAGSIPGDVIQLGSTLEFGQGIAGHIIKNRKEYHLEQDYSKSRYSVEEYSSLYGAYLGISLSIPKGERDGSKQSDIVGVLSVFDRRRPKGFSIDKDVATLLTLGQQAALAIRWNDLLHRQESVRYTLSTISSNLDFEAVITEILKEMKGIVPFDSGSLQLLVDNSLKIFSCSGFEHPELIIDLEFPLSKRYPNAEVISTREPYAIIDVRNSYPVFLKDADRLFSGDVRSWIGVPIIAGDAIIGIFALDRHQVVPFTDEEIEIAEVFASHAAIAIQNARLYQDLKEQETALSYLHDTADIILQPEKLPEIMDTVVKAAVEVSSAFASAIYIFDNVSQRHVISESHFYPNEFRLPEPDLSSESGILRRFIDRRDTLRIKDVESDREPVLYEHSIRSVIALPIFVQDDVTGALVVFDNERRHFSKKEPFLSILAGQATIALRNSRLLLKERQRADELSRLSDYLDEVLNYMESQRNLTMFGAVYGESIHQAGNKLGIVKKKLTGISKGQFDSDIAKIKRIVVKAVQDITKYEQTIANMQTKFVETGPIKRLDIRDIIENEIRSMRISRLIDIRRDYNPDVPGIYGPQKQLSHFIYVVIDNAVKSMSSSGEGTLTITTGVEDSDHIRVSVKDTGHGIPSSVEAKLFEVKPGKRKRPTGRGIGLPWVRSTLRQYGGDVDYETVLDEGTTMHLIIPQQFELVQFTDKGSKNFS